MVYCGIFSFREGIISMVVIGYNYKFLFVCNGFIIVY